jgi:hypothetical protein
MTQNKAQRPAKAREFAPTDNGSAAPDEALLRDMLDELRAIRARLEQMELDEAIARGVRWAIGGRVNGPDNTKG